jgi:hypothetical protein
MEKSIRCHFENCFTMYDYAFDAYIEYKQNEIFENWNIM